MDSPAEEEISDEAFHRCPPQDFSCTLFFLLTDPPEYGGLELHLPEGHGSRRGCRTTRGPSARLLREKEKLMLSP